jgi:uncharacterized protein (TIGR02284 family)
MFSSSSDNTALNDLIKVTIDSADGYRKAAEAADNHAFRTIFMERASERDAIVADMQQYVRAQGETPEDDGSMVAGLHRIFLNLRDVVTGSDDKAIVAEVERGEDYIKARYEKARADGDLSADVRALIDTAYVKVKAGHDQMRDLKHGMQSPTGSST